jgi:hypothetical protein
MTGVYPSLARSALRAALTALLLSVAFALLSVVAATRDTAPLRAELREAVDSGVLAGSMGLPLGSRVVPAFEGNDCLELVMLALPSGRPWRDALSPRRPVRAMPLGPPPAEFVTAWCLRLAEVLDPAAPEEPMRYYDRYLHGQRVAGALLIPSLGVAGLRDGVTLVLVAGLAALVLAAGLGAMRRGLADGLRDAGFAWLALGFLLFYGLPIYGRYWSHAMADLAPMAFLWLAWLLPPRGDEGDAGPAWLLGGFGCTVAIFEFLTGGLPLGAALVLLVAALGPRPPSLRGCVASLAAFGVGVLVPVVVKLVIGHFAFADFMTAEEGGQLLHRLQGPVVAEMSPREIKAVAAHGFDARRLDAEPWLRLPYLTFRLAYFAFVPGLGSTVLGLIALGGSTLLVLLLAWRARGEDAARTLAVIGACGVVTLWYLAFLSHTLLHTAWMVRCAVVLPLAAGVLALQGWSGARAFAHLNESLGIPKSAPN